MIWFLSSRFKHWRVEDIILIFIVICNLCFPRPHECGGGAEETKYNYSRVPGLPLAYSRGNSSPCFQEPPKQHFCVFNCLAFSSSFAYFRNFWGLCSCRYFLLLRLIYPRDGWLVWILSGNQPLRQILLFGESQLLLLLLSSIIWFQKWPCAQWWPHFSSAWLPKHFLCHFQSCPSPWKWFSSLMILRQVTSNMMWLSVRSEEAGGW